MIIIIILCHCSIVYIIYCFTVYCSVVFSSISCIIIVVAVVVVGVFTKVFLENEESRVELEQDLRDQRIAAQRLLDEETVKVESIKEKKLPRNPA
ncbi:MAG: hypothetical protein S4CHLAM37_13510 [Chlamydiia bacterium]|nr:hypothetical protein [Chlamydiia bacterium]